MKSIYSTLSFVVATGFVAVQAADSWQYPVAPTTNQVDVFWGEKVEDPYRWMEDNSSEDLKKWIDAENVLTESYFASIPERSKLKERLTKLWNYERWGIPFKGGERMFVFRNDGLQNQSVLYVCEKAEQASGNDADWKVFFDPNKLSTDGTVAFSGLSVSDDGKWMAYGLSASGSDWQEWHVKDVATGEDIADHLKWIKFSDAQWAKNPDWAKREDAKADCGFFYCRYDEPDASRQYQADNTNQQIFFHRVGDSQNRDVLVFNRPEDPKQYFDAVVSNDDDYLIVSAHTGTAPLEEISIVNLRGRDATPICILPGFEADYRYIHNEGTRFWFFTDYQAPRGRVISFDISAPQKENWTEVIPQVRDTLEGVNVLNNRLIGHYLKDATSQIRIFALDGKLVREVTLPGGSSGAYGTVGGFGGKAKDRDTYYSYTDFTKPATIYRYDVQSGRSTLFKAAEVDFASSEYEVHQVFYPSKDGTMIPMFVSHKKGLELNGKNPTLLYGYGGFNISMLPGFSVIRAVWMEMGGVMAIANLRGGGEYGEDWHAQGIKLKKQNVFDDFISAAEWLISNKYTCSDKLAIQGGSNGGLLVGACLLQRPELFGAALPAVGVMDMMRYHLFTIGWAWNTDYGLVTNEDEFHALRAYSPVHNVKKGVKYPATLVTTADHDDRVVPAHSFKFAAALQAAQAGDKPVLIRIETKAGHSAGKPTSKRIEESVDMLSFLIRELNME